MVADERARTEMRGNEKKKKRGKERKKEEKKTGEKKKITDESENHRARA